jgi:predicted transcriptional regulator
MSKLDVHVGSAHDMGQRFVSAFGRAAAGESFTQRNITFMSLDDMMKALTPRRLEMLRHLRRTGGANSIMALARLLGRDYKRVYEDVAVLENAGLITKEEGHLGTPWDTLSAEVAL